MRRCRLSLKVSRARRPIRSHTSSGSGSVATMSEYIGATARRGSRGAAAVKPSVARTMTPARTSPRVGAQPAGRDLRRPRSIRAPAPRAPGPPPPDPRTSRAGCSAAQCGVNVPPRHRVGLRTGPRPRRGRAAACESSPKPQSRQPATSAWARSHWASFRGRRRRNRRAERHRRCPRPATTCRRSRRRCRSWPAASAARRRDEPDATFRMVAGKMAEHQPPLRPEAP